MCGGTNCFAELSATAVSLNSHIIRVRLTDGVEREFVRTDDRPELLIGPAPWKAIERPERRMLNVIKGGAADPKHDEYCFVGGKLRFISKAGKDAEVKTGDAFETNASTGGERQDITNSVRQCSLAELWPTAASRRAELQKNDIWRGSGRIRFFTRNPNRLAMILAQFAVIFLGISLFARQRIWMVHGVLWFLISFVLLLQTGSRGGFLALFAGLLPILFFRFRHLVSRRVLVLAFVGFAFMAGMAYWVYASHRVSADHSTSQRIYMWREVPRMIATAPMGWGLWQSGPAYNSWFEKPDRMHMIGDLFNDHLSRFVEGGFIFGGVYIFLWVLAFTLSWRHAGRGGTPVPLALLVSYWVASSFNPMNYWRPSFYVMGAFIAMVVLLRLIKCKRMACRFILPSFFSIVFSFAITVVLLGVIAGIAFFANDSEVPLRVSPLGHRIVVGTGEPKLWVADDGFVLCGDYNGFPGRELRDFYRKHPHAEAVGLVESLANLPKAVDRLVITGKLCEEFLEHSDSVKANQVVLYSPPFGSKRVKAALRKKFNIEFLTGEFAAQRTGDNRLRRKWVHIIPGAELYIPHWLDMVVMK